ncbi:MAG: hypothetical protein ACJA04_000599 [Cellvibrionaceae bacterium]|jgi:hypothetical protein
MSAGFGLGADKAAASNVETVGGAVNNIGQSNGQVGSVNGGLNASNSRTRIKETVLTNLTGENVNINVEGHTGQVGSVIAAVDENGADDAQGCANAARAGCAGAANGNLTLNTQSYDYADLSNTAYSSEQSAGISTSVGLNGSDQKATQAQKNNKDEKDNPLRLNTSNLNYSNNLSVDKSKTLATLGNGDINIRDDIENGADATKGLNRDLENTEKELFSHSQSQSVEATIDHRLFSEDGQKQIKEDIKRTQLLIDAIGDTATEESIQLQDLRQHIGDLQRELDVQEALARQEDGKHAQALNNPDATPEQKRDALNVYAATYADTFDISIEKAMLIAVDQFNNNGEMVAGIHYTQNGKSVIVINDNAQQNGLGFAKTLGHEMTHAQIVQGTIRDRGEDVDGKDLNEDYSKVRGEYAEDLYGFSFSQNDLGEVDTGITNTHQNNNSSQIINDNHAKLVKDNPQDADFYNEAGHYYTTYYVALRAGIDPETARTLATFSQAPDEITDLDAISVAVRSVVATMGTLATDPRENPAAALEAGDAMLDTKKEMERIQQNLHALTGGSAEAMTELVTGLIQKSESPEEKGILLHLLADSYAHRTLDDENTLYSTGKGHLWDGTDPDLIHNRPDLYGQYVDELIKVISPAATTTTERENIKNELLEAVNTAMDQSTITGRAGQAARHNGKVNDGLASDNTIESIGDLTRQLAEQYGVMVDRPENHGLPHLNPDRTPEQDAKSYQQQAGGDMDAQAVITASEAVIEQLQKNQPPITRNKIL